MRKRTSWNHVRGSHLPSGVRCLPDLCPRRSLFEQIRWEEPCPATNWPTFAQAVTGLLKGKCSTAPVPLGNTCRVGSIWSSALCYPLPNCVGPFWRPAAQSAVLQSRWTDSSQFCAPHQIPCFRWFLPLGMTQVPQFVATLAEVTKTNAKITWTGRMTNTVDGNAPKWAGVNSGGLHRGRSGSG